jgi:hypothetical protein
MKIIQQAKSEITGRDEAATIMPTLISDIDAWKIEGYPDCDLELLFPEDTENELDDSSEYQQIRRIRARLKPKEVNEKRTMKEIEELCSYYSSQAENNKDIDYLVNNHKLYRNQTLFCDLLGLIDKDDLIDA